MCDRSYIRYTFLNIKMKMYRKGFDSVLVIGAISRLSLRKSPIVQQTLFPRSHKQTNKKLVN